MHPIHSRLNQPKRISILAMAIGLACGGTVVAEDDATSDAEDQGGTFSSSTEWSRDEGENMARETETDVTRPMYSTRYPAELLDYSFQTEHDLYSFSDAIRDTGLASELETGTEYTIFAPTDDAFREFEDRKGEVSTEELRNILRNHIVSGRITAEQAGEVNSAQPISGDAIQLSKSGDALEVGDAAVLKADLKSGILTVHTIDAVLTPASSEGEQEEAE